MEEWIVFQHPGLLCCYGVALFLCLFEKKYLATKGVFIILSAVMVLCGTAVCFLSGAALEECATILLVFLLLNMEVGK